MAGWLTCLFLLWLAGPPFAAGQSGPLLSTHGGDRPLQPHPSNLARGGGARPRSGARQGQGATAGSRYWQQALTDRPEETSGTAELAAGSTRQSASQAQILVGSRHSVDGEPDALERAFWTQAESLLQQHSKDSGAADLSFFAASSSPAQYTRTAAQRGPAQRETVVLLLRNPLLQVAREARRDCVNNCSRTELAGSVGSSSSSTADAASSAPEAELTAAMLNAWLDRDDHDDAATASQPQQQQQPAAAAACCATAVRSRAFQHSPQCRNLAVLNSPATPSSAELSSLLHTALQALPTALVLLPEEFPHASFCLLLLSRLPPSSPSPTSLPAPCQSASRDVCAGPPAVFPAGPAAQWAGPDWLAALQQAERDSRALLPVLHSGGVRMRLLASRAGADVTLYQAALANFAQQIEHVRSRWNVTLLCPRDLARLRARLDTLLPDPDPHVVHLPARHPATTHQSATANPAASSSSSRQQLRTLRLKAYVVGTMANSTRMQRFCTSWTRAWPALEFLFVQGHARPMRGQGLTEAFVMAVDDAIEQDVDLMLVMEDDVVPFENTMWPADLVARLHQVEGCGFLFLGAHRIRYYDTPSFSPSSQQVVRIYSLLGSYAWVAERAVLPALAQLYRQDLLDAQRKQSTHVDPDVSWTRLWDRFPAYISVPLLVDHPPGYSATWKKYRASGWEGHPDFWNYPDDPYWLTRPLLKASCVLLLALTACCFLTAAGTRYRHRLSSAIRAFSLPTPQSVVR
eukprot:g68116.t1